MILQGSLGHLCPVKTRNFNLFSLLTILLSSCCNSICFLYQKTLLSCDGRGAFVRGKNNWVEESVDNI